MANEKNIFGEDLAVSIKVGDILEGDFGYSMVLPAFYKVLAITPSGKSAKIRRMDTLANSSDGGWTGTCIPAEGRWYNDEVLTKRIGTRRWRHGQPQEYVKVRNTSFTIWNGKPAYFDHWD